MTTLTDIWGNDVELTADYVSHRNRLIDISQIQTFHSKGKKLFINTFKQNTSVPTMCIFFDTKEKAAEAFETMRDVHYGSAPLALKRPQTQTQPALSSSQMLIIFLTTLSPLFVFLFVMLVFSAGK